MNHNPPNQAYPRDFGAGCTWRAALRGLLRQSCAAFIVLAGLVGSGAALAQTFTCDGTMYQTFGGPQGSTDTILRKVILTTGSPTVPAVVTYQDVGVAFPLNVNAAGYNFIDNYIYAIVQSSNELVRIDSNGNVLNLGPVTNLPVANLEPDLPNGNKPTWNAGAISPAGVMYVKLSTDSRYMYSIDVSSPLALANLTATEITLTSSLGGLNSIQTADLAWAGGVGGSLYAVGSADGNLINITPPGIGVNAANFTRFTQNNPDLAPDLANNGNRAGCGALYGAANGLFCGNNYRNTLRGGFYKFNTVTGFARYLADADPTGNQDGAVCPVANIEFPVDLSITKTDNKDLYVPGSPNAYTIVVGNSGFGVLGALVNDLLPAGAASSTWSCTASLGASCGSPTSGSGSIINKAVDLEPNTTVTFTFNTLVSASHTGSFINSATVEPPAGSFFTRNACTPPASSNAATGACTATDTDLKAPTLSVTKISNGGVGTFAFSGTNGWTNQSITTDTSGVGKTGVTQNLTAVAQTDLSETLPAGFVLSSISCSGLGAGGTATTNLTGAPDGGGIPAYSVRLDAAATAAGSAIACTFTNDKPPTLSLQKALGGTGRIAAADQFILSGTGTGAPAGVTTTGATTAVTSASYSFTATAGSPYVLTETMAPGSASTLAQYSQAVSCSNTGPTVVTGLTSLPINVTPVAGDAIVCTVTNTPAAPTLSLQKALGGTGRINAADQFTVSAAGDAAAVAASGAATTTSTGAVSTVTAGTGRVSFTAAAGTAYILNEVMAVGSSSALTRYGQTVSCSNTGPTSVAGLTSLPINVTPALGDAIVCTVTNTPAAPTLSLQKALGGTGRINGADQFTVSAVGDAAAVAASGAATTTSTGAVSTVTAGSGRVSFTGAAGTAYSLNEVMTVGSVSPLTLYTQSVACTNTGPTSVAALTSMPITVTPALGDAIVCTVTNTPTPAFIVPAKSTAVTSVSAGTVIPYTLTLTNSGGSTQATGYEFYEVVPAHTTFTSVGGLVNSNCALGAVAGTLCTLTTTASIAAGANLAVTFTVTANTPIPAGVTSIANALYTAPPAGCVGSVCPAPVCPDPLAAACVSTPTVAFIGLAKSTALASVADGEAIPYTLTLTNSGGGTQAAGYVFYEVVPANTTFTSVGGSVFSSCAPGAVAGTLCMLTTTASIAGGASLAVTFTVTAFSPIPEGVDNIYNAIYSTPPAGCVGTSCPAPVCPDPLAVGCVTTPTAPVAPLFLIKTASKVEAEIGDTVRYQLTIKSPSGRLQRAIVITDRLPAGFRYIAGTTLLNGVKAADPEGGAGPVLTFAVGDLPRAGAGANPNESVVTYTTRVGVGAQQGDGINRARGRSQSGVQSNEARARVRVIGGVFTTQACVAGKVFVDCNNNHVQDAEELGIPGVRLYLEDGTWFITDSEGKYSYCGLKPTTHGLKVDPFTLPRGSRVTTTSSRNLGDGNSLFLDTKNGELGRGDFVEGSCSNRVIEQVKARRGQGEVRSPENETPHTGLSFKGNAPGAARQASESADQTIVKPGARADADSASKDK